MSKKNDDERIKHLKKLGLATEGKSLAPVLKQGKMPPVHQPESDEIVLAPPGVDPKTMDVDDITFDPRLLDQFPSLEGDGYAAASRYVYAIYGSRGKDKLRNGAVHRKISTFISTVRAQRKAPGVIKEKVKTTAEERDLAQLVAAAGLTTEELAKILKERAG